MYVARESSCSPARRSAVSSPPRRVAPWAAIRPRRGRRRPRWRHDRRGPRRGAGGASVARAAGDGRTIRIKNYQFETSSLTVPAGTTVSWLNDDVDVHTATSRTRAFSSPGLDPSETYSFRFDTPGTYAYF